MRVSLWNDHYLWEDLNQCLPKIQRAHRRQGIRLHEETVQRNLGVSELLGTKLCFSLPRPKEAIQKC